jgi:hypothetical protein
MDEIIEVMARADVDYFWQDPGKRFVDFEKPIADGVRARMTMIRQALDIRLRRREKGGRYGRVCS